MLNLKAGGMGIRYTCRICNKQVYLFNDEGKWFMGAKIEKLPRLSCSGI